MYISNAHEILETSIYTTEKTFSDFNLHTTLLTNIANAGYVNPTKIQDQVIPQIQNGSDILGIGRTGSGKTAAFLIPTINKAIDNRGTKVLILSPTRELATQTSDEFKKLAFNTGLKSVVIMGGAGYNEQMRRLRERCNFVIATPGRLRDLQKRGHINLKSFNHIVLDEVDQMLDMGFIEDIKYFTSLLPETRQSLFFSATMSPKEEVLANALLKNPVKIESEATSPLNTINQDIVKISHRSEKISVLFGLLEKTEFSKVLVFSSTKIGADNISDELRKKGIKVDSLHGNKSQSKRTQILGKFKRNELKVLVATDVASRGIDVPNISHVINYDEPATYNDYIHRIGRTGRIGRAGVALTFVLGDGR